MFKFSLNPFDFVILKDEDYFFVHTVKNRTTEIGDLPELIVTGVLFDKYSFKKIGLEGENTKNFLNIKTATLKQINTFIKNNLSSCYQNGSDWAYVHDITSIVKRKPTVFNFLLEKEIKII